MAEATTTLVHETLVMLIRAHPELTLAQLTVFGPESLARVRVGDLVVDPTLRARAAALRGPEFDACVLEVIHEVGDVVASSFVRERVGGPRWRLQASLGRLVDAGRLVRTGSTGATRYRSAQPRRG